MFPFRTSTLLNTALNIVEQERSLNRNFEAIWVKNRYTANSADT